MIGEIVIRRGRNQYKVSLYTGAPVWYALMWGWWPNGGDTPSHRWQKVDHVPPEVEEEFKECGIPARRK